MLGQLVQLIVKAIEDTDLFNKIFNEIYEQTRKGYTTEESDQLNAKLTSGITGQESVEASATTAEPTADLMPEHSVPLGLDTDIAKLQDDVIAIAQEGSNFNCLLPSGRWTYSKR